MMLKKMLLERLQVPFTPGVPKASPEAFEFGLTSVTPSRTRCAWWGVWRAECYRITARSWEQGVVELAPITVSVGPKLHLLILLVTAGDSSCLPGGHL